MGRGNISSRLLNRSHVQILACIARMRRHEVSGDGPHSQRHVLLHLRRSLSSQRRKTRFEVQPLRQLLVNLKSADFLTRAAGTRLALWATCQKRLTCSLTPEVSCENHMPRNFFSGGLGSGLHYSRFMGCGSSDLTPELITQREINHRECALLFLLVGLLTFP